jgi:hypothetical protein
LPATGRGLRLRAMTDSSSSPGGVRLAELVAVLSLGADLGMGQPMEHAMRQCLIALRLGESLGLDEGERASLYYVSLIAWVGCHIDAYEQAKWFGDDLALKGDSPTCAVAAAVMRAVSGDGGGSSGGCEYAGTPNRLTDTPQTVSKPWLATSMESPDGSPIRSVG